MRYGKIGDVNVDRLVDRETDRLWDKVTSDDDWVEYCRYCSEPEDSFCACYRAAVAD